jgi:hypothetical protein
MAPRARGLLLLGEVSEVSGERYSAQCSIRVEFCLVCCGYSSFFSVDQF